MTADIYDHGQIKFPNAGLLLSSAGRGWRGIGAELRMHPAGELPAQTPVNTEITLAITGNEGASVSRTGGGKRQDTIVKHGALWLCPAGVREDDTRISGFLPEILHVYLPPERFTELALLSGDHGIRGQAVRYLADVQDELVRQLGFAILGELRAESSAGRLLVEAAALTLTAHLTQHYRDDDVGRSVPADRSAPERISRAVSYVHDNLASNLSVARLAEVACLSPFHFARLFKDVVGQTPHAYISALRLEAAKSSLAGDRSSLSSIAFDAGFSSQAAFNRRFLSATGLTPGEFRRRFSQTPKHF